MKHLILPQCINNIKRFYRNVAKKYAHSYSRELMHKNIDDAIDSMYRIEKDLLRREPSVEKWNGCFMANTKTWYFAYKVFDDVIVVIDACHAQNMK